MCIARRRIRSCRDGVTDHRCQAPRMPEQQRRHRRQEFVGLNAFRHPALRGSVLGTGHPIAELWPPTDAQCSEFIIDRLELVETPARPPPWEQLPHGHGAFRPAAEVRLRPSRTPEIRIGRVSHHRLRQMVHLLRPSPRRSIWHLPCGSRVVIPRGTIRHGTLLVLISTRRQPLGTLAQCNRTRYRRARAGWRRTARGGEDAWPISR